MGGSKNCLKGAHAQCGPNSVSCWGAVRVRSFFTTTQILSGLYTPPKSVCLIKYLNREKGACFFKFSSFLGMVCKNH